VKKTMNKKAILGVGLVVLFGLSMAIGQTQAQETELQEVFSINLLSPNTSAARNQWSLLMENQLPKIGIGVDFHESTGWGNIAPRTWAYPLLDFDYIPTYAEGGFDILFVGWSWGIDWNPLGLFDTPSLPPLGDNFYQYSNPAYDAKMTQYLTELDQATQIGYAKEMQAMLYEDLPAIVLIYPKSLFGFKEGLTGIDGLLLGAGVARYEFWDDPADHIIKYAIPADLKEYNIFVVSSFYDSQWMQGTHGGLYARQQITNIYETQLAAGFPIYSVDQKNLTVEIDPNAKFSDGSPVLAEDFAYTMQLHMTPAVSSTSYSYYRTWYETNASVYAEGTHTIHFNMTDSNAFALGLISFGIIDKSVVEPLVGTHGYSLFQEVPLTGNVGDALVSGAGPFMVETYDSVNSVVKLVPNTHYEDLAGYENALLSEWYITFISGKDTAVAELIAGNVDIVDAQYYPVVADFAPVGVEGVLVSDPSHQEMAINLKHPVFGTGELTPVGTPAAAKAVRKAISHSVPRDVIVDQILEGLGAPGVTPCPIVAVCYDDTLLPYAYDLDLAIEYMEDAGFEVYTTIITPTTTGIVGLVFLSFLGLASVLALRRYRK
jgi:ABC-type transport system substrate-binding protein